jgi:hypothetical protein
MKVALDTNILAYAEGAYGAAMRDRALEVIQRLRVGVVVFRYRRWVSCSTCSSEKRSGGRHARGQPC